MEKKSNKKPLIALAVLAIIGIVGGTFAYFTSTATFENLFKTATYRTVTSETFVSPQNWTPGTTTDKTLTIKNEGNIQVGVQVCYRGYWSDSSIAANLVTVNSANTNKWTYTAGTQNASEINGCYKYNSALATNATAETPIASVKLAADAGTAQSGAANCQTQTSGNTKTVTCTAGNLNGATFHLDITTITVQWDKFEEYLNP